MLKTTWKWSMLLNHPTYRIKNSLVSAIPRAVYSVMFFCSLDFVWWQKWIELLAEIGHFGAKSYKPLSPFIPQHLETSDFAALQFTSFLHVYDVHIYDMIHNNKQKKLIWECMSFILGDVENFFLTNKHKKVHKSEMKRLNWTDWRESNRCPRRWCPASSSGDGSSQSRLASSPLISTLSTLSRLTYSHTEGSRLIEHEVPQLSRCLIKQ